MKLKDFQIILFILLLTACQTEADKQLAYALQIAGNNRPELEKVIEHYKNDPLKLKATQFLISNMLAHRGVDSVAVTTFQSTYDKYQAISEKHKWERSREWQKEINDLWKKEQNTLLHKSTEEKPDVKQVKADWLINEIDRSFKAWHENVYTRNCSFEDFCKHILPFRFVEGLYLDNSRDVFYKRHAHIFNDQNKDFREVTDSLHQIYSFLMHNNWTASSLPIYNAATFEQIKRGSCDSKAWYNCLLMSALGMAVAIDFVPEWGNRAGGHSWNSLIVNKETHPFEPFWDDDRWKYKRIYNNESIDQHWGKFRLPKVYRHTYESYITGPLEETDIDREDIPALFRNPFIADVSSQYFKTTDIKIKITKEIPQDTKYCYLCVFGAKTWHPVQWGKIEWNKEVTFKAMGKDIVYLPMFYKNGSLTPAGQTFILNKDGNCEEVKCSQDKISVTVRNYTSYLYPEEIAEAKETLTGSYLVGCNDLNASIADTLHLITDSMDAWNNEVTFLNPSKYRYIQLISPKDSVALCEISFFEQGKEEIPVQHVKVSAGIASLVTGEELEMVSDHRSATGFKGLFNNEEKKNILWFDLGEPRFISKISYIPYTKNYLPKDTDVELWYWDDQWVLAGKLKGNYSYMTFDNVPEGTIYRIKRANDRIFTYKNGIIHWY